VTRVAGIGLLTGWGDGVSALPDDARAAAGGRGVVAIDAPARAPERFRRATRECLLGIAAVEAMLTDAGLSRGEIAGERTGLLYVTAAAYGASNRRFIESAGGTLHFPYTAPSAVPAEVAIEFTLCGPYVILIGGATATLDALWQADVLLARGACARVLALAVETFAECEDLHARAHRVEHGPLVEAAACALLIPCGSRAIRGAAGPSALERTVRRRAGVTLACEPLIAAALARGAGDERPVLTAEWRSRRSSLALAGEAASGASVAS
jgi:hypothetical protein